MLTVIINIIIGMCNKQYLFLQTQFTNTMQSYNVIKNFKILTLQCAIFNVIEHFISLAPQLQVLGVQISTSTQLLKNFTGSIKMVNYS